MPRRDERVQMPIEGRATGDPGALLSESNAVLWQRELGSGRLRFVSPDIESVLGYSSQRWVSEPGFWASVVHPEDRTAVEARMKELLAHPAGGVMQYRAIHADGTSVRLTDTIIGGVELERTRRLGVIVPSPRSVTGPTLGYDEDKYRRIVEVCPRAILIHRDGVILFANAAAAELLGAPDPDLLCGLTVRQLAHPDFFEAAETRAKRVQEEGTPAATLEERATRLDGREILVNATSVPYTFRGQSAVLTVAEDVTEQRRAQDLQQLLTAALNATREAIILVRLRDGVIIQTNRSWGELTGEGVVARGRPFGSLAMIANPDEVRRLFALVRSGRHVRDAWLTIRLANGRLRHLQMAAERVLIGDEPHMLAHGSDMTEHLSLEQQQRQSQKMEALGRLAGGITHDFNNLLTVISSFAQLAEEDLADAAHVREALREILRASFRAAELTSTLLSFSRGTQTERTTIDVDLMIEDLQRMLDRVLGPQVELVHEPSDTPALVTGNRGALEQVLVNLVVNSRDAMPTGGTITIRVRHLDVRHEEGLSPDGFVIPPGRYVKVQVTDTGIGIPSDAREHVFEPFFSTKPPEEGTGLGLSTAYGIVRQHGGHIWFDTGQDEGTTFHIVLPDEQETGDSAAER